MPGRNQSIPTIVPLSHVKHTAARLGEDLPNGIGDLKARLLHQVLRRGPGLKRPFLDLLHFRAGNDHIRAIYCTWAENTNQTALGGPLL